MPHKQRHNQAPSKFRPWHAAVAAGALIVVAAGSRLIPSGEAPNNAPTDLGEPLPAATATLPPSEAPKTPPASPSPSPSIESAPPTPEGAVDTHKDTRRLIAARYTGCSIRGYTDDGTKYSGSDKVRQLVFTPTVESNPASIAARDGRNQTSGDITWQDSALVPYVIDPTGKATGQSYGSKDRRGGANPGITEVYMPLDPNEVAKGTIAVMGIETTATSEMSDGQIVSTVNFQPCTGDSVVAFDGKNWDPSDIAVPGGIPAHVYDQQG